MRTLSRRETVALNVALLVVPALAFYRFRWEPYQETASRLQSKAAESRALEADPTQLATLRQMATERRQAVRELRERVTVLKRRFAPDSNPVQQQLVVDISDLAARCGVRIEESQFPVSDAAAALAGGTADGTRYRRAGEDTPALSLVEQYTRAAGREPRLLKLRVDSSFGGLLRFFSELSGLRWRVTPIRFDIRRKELVTKDGTGRVTSRLETTVLLAL
jgi:hypothetical protein